MRVVGCIRIFFFLIFRIVVEYIHTKINIVTSFKCTVCASLVAQLVKNPPAMQETWV